MNTLPSRATPARPLVPEDISAASAARSLVRAAFAAFRAGGQVNPAALCAKIYPSDAVALAVLNKAAVAGATTTDPAWAGALVSRTTGEFLGSLGPRSAASVLIGQGTQVQLGNGVGPADIPIIAAPITAAPWVAESGAIPVLAYTLGTVPLDPKKMAVIVVMSHELNQFSGASAVFDSLLRETAAFSLDAAYFSTTAGSASAHAGLLAGLTPLAGSDDMAADLSALAGAVSGPGASGRVVFVAAPGRAANIALRSGEITATALPSSVVPADRVIAVDPLSLIHGFGPDPDISSSIDAVVHMSDAPTNIGLPGSPPTVAAPAVSMLQAGMVATRMLLDFAFAKRRPDAVAFANGCTW